MNFNDVQLRYESLRDEIDKAIHEVFGDADVWSLNEAARVAETPIVTPEPTSLAMLALGATALLARRPRNK